MTEYSYTQYSRLTPYTKWNGGRITDVDLLTLDEAASLATKHAKIEITINDFLRAAKRGEILLRAIVHKSVTMQPCRESDTELFVPETSIPTLPIEACQSLANVSVAKWRHINGHEPIENLGGQMGTYKRWELPDGEPDFETNLADCRVIGNDVHALADSYISQEFEAHWDDILYKSNYWRKRQSITLIEAAIIFHGMNPLEETEESAKCVTNYDDSNKEFKSTPEDFKLLLRHFKEVERIQPLNRTLREWYLIAKSDELKVHPRIEKWFKDDETVPATSKLENGHQSITFENPHEPTQAPTNIINLALDDNIVPVKSEPDSKPWNVKDERDPEPSHFQAWYTAARYFARILIKDDPSLLQKTEQLVKKIQSDLLKINVTKRGGKKPPATATIKKALQNIKFN